MQNQNRRLGKGLDALIPTIIPNTKFLIEHIPIMDISPNPFQPRQVFDTETLNELARSIKQHGLAQPIIVRKVNGNFELVVGERRLEACKIIELETVPAIVRDVTDQESCEIALVENIDRKNLNIIEVAQSLQRMITEFSHTQDTLSGVFNRSRSSIANILRLLKLPAVVQDLIMNSKLTEGHGRALIEFSDDEYKCVDLANKIIHNNLSVRQAETMCRAQKKSKKIVQKKPHLFDNYIEKLSQKFDTVVDIKHSRNKLIVSISYDKFKDHIDFLERLCMMDASGN